MHAAGEIEPQDQSASVGQLIRHYRRGLGLTQEELASQAKISPRALWNLEVGRTRHPRRHTLQALATVLTINESQAQELVRAARAEAAPATVRALLEPAPPALIPGPAGSAPSHAPAVCQLPPAAGAFAGRDGDRAQLVALGQARDGIAPRMAVISGRAGVGKTALALHVAHALAGRYPDAALYCDLSGTGASRSAPADTLDRFLRALGMPADQVPVDFDEKVACYRAWTYGRRALVVLDNAADERQVRWLVPGSPSVMVLVTSRWPLAGLEATWRGTLDALAPADSLTVLAAIIGDDRVAREPAAARRLVDQCGRLPLALRVVGNQLRARPDWTIGYFSRRLRPRERRLDLLQAGDLVVRAALTSSYEQLSRRAQCLFRRLPLVDVEDLDAGLGALLTGGTRADAERLLDELAAVHLLQPSTPSGCYRIDELTTVFAEERQRAEEVPQELAAVLDRLRRHARTTPTGAPIPPGYFPAVLSAPDRADRREWFPVLPLARRGPVGPG